MAPVSGAALRWVHAATDRDVLSRDDGDKHRHGTRHARQARRVCPSGCPKSVRFWTGRVHILSRGKNGPWSRSYMVVRPVRGPDERMLRLS